VVFPLGSSEQRIPLPFEVGRLAFSPDGRELYALSLGVTRRGTPSAPGIFKIEFNPTRQELVAGSEGLSANSLAVSYDKSRIFVSGGYRSGRSAETCGLFEFRTSDREVRQILKTESCNYTAGWLRLSLSEDAKLLLAEHNRRLEIIDIAKETLRPVGEGLISGAWSPDGRWIAATTNDRHTVALLNAASLAVERSLSIDDDDGLVWSPDSRYLLVKRACGAYGATLEMIRIEDGRILTVDASKCQMHAVIGWINVDVLKQ
jgi:WD40 repeat protein